MEKFKVISTKNFIEEFGSYKINELEGFILKENDNFVTPVYINVI